MTLGFDQDDLKYFRNQWNLFENSNFWINSNLYIKTLKGALKTLALEKLWREQYYQGEH